MYLEGHAGLDVALESLGDGTVEVCEDLHGELWLNLTLRDKLIESIHEHTSGTAKS